MTGVGFPWADALADRYRIERELGRGGMAVVYLVRDLKHDREVALKVLRPELSAALGRDRFAREIQLTARLQHPHILPVFDSGDSEGQLWYTMPFVDGETLRARITREGRLPVAAAIQLAREVASALAYAHEAGVVHRDIKPENILLSRQGEALVADFGIAKGAAAEEGLTETGLALGTPSYMAPEQLLGERPVRPQADVYAFGVMLYEMLAGSRPFAESAPAAMLARRLSHGSPLISEQYPEVPPAIALLIRDTLEVDPGRRPASGATLAERLQLSSGHTPPAATVVSPVARRTTSRARALAVVALLLAGAAALILPRIRAADDPSVGVLPFENRSGDSSQAYLSEGVTDELTARLSAVTQLNVSPRSSTVRFRGSTDAPETIADTLGVRYLLIGGVARLGDSVRLTVELIDAPARRQKWSETRVGPTRALAALIDSVAHTVVHTLAPSVEDSASRRGPGTSDSMAYNYYLLAQHHWNRFTEPDLSASLAYSDSAIARDPAFVDAWLIRASNLLALASGNGHLTGRETLGPLRQALDTIFVLDPASGQAHAIRGQVYIALELDWNAASREFRQALVLDPGHAINYVRAAFLETALGRTDSALALLRHAEGLEPTNIRVVTAEAVAAYFGRRYAESLAISTRALALDPYFPAALQFNVLGLSAVGRHDDAITAARRAAANPAPILAATLAIALAQGDSGVAGRLIADSLAAHATRDGVGAGPVFRAYAALGDADQTFAWIDKAIAERSFNVAYLHVDPLLDQFRSDPRFAAAVARAGLPPP